MTKFPFEDDDDKAKELDDYLAGVMDDFLAECEPTPARLLFLVKNGKPHKVRIEGNVLWFPNVKAGRVKT